MTTSHHLYFLQWHLIAIRDKFLRQSLKKHIQMYVMTIKECLSMTVLRDCEYFSVLNIKAAF